MYKPLSTILAAAGIAACAGRGEREIIPPTRSTCISDICLPNERFYVSENEGKVYLITGTTLNGDETACFYKPESLQWKKFCGDKGVPMTSELARVAKSAKETGDTTEFEPLISKLRGR